MTDYHILIIDDEKDLREELCESLERDEYRVFDVGLPSKAFKILETEHIDIVILDIKLPEMSGIEVLKKIKEQKPDIEVIMITGHADKDFILQSMRAGALDFFYKPLKITDIKLAFERTKKYIKLQHKVQRLTSANTLLSGSLQQSIGDIIGTGTSMKHVLDLTLTASKSADTPILVTGPSGSGKELIARTIHYAGSRKDYPFYTLNCSAIPETLIESEFFGYKKGAFTGAFEDTSGCFENADKGTLFLDEVGDLSLAAQAKLLRALEDGKIKHVGGRYDIQTNVRIVSATNKDIKALIKEQKFREDLYYRLNTIEIKLPPLSERKEDIPSLIKYYIDYYSQKMNKGAVTISDELMSVLTDYPFPGNIRELRNIVERALIYCDDAVLTCKHFPCLNERSIITAVDSQTQTGTEHAASYNLYTLERNTIIKALQVSGYHQLHASKLLGITPSALNRKMKKFSIIKK